ncbi:hypothetical protein JUJ52_19680 [Virgibacillus sp. AGTR]|uniref:hypothetical protein n=1 Tax=Virgibacillus sp. AGTR TaxID=2812055 RepID=UPI001D16782E|nr:hypothetical protein [Virgibacillus sp. AGTR]MCC2252154.1 hypothetical protein [Virgibacillus sp. AGTR]
MMFEIILMMVLLLFFCWWAFAIAIKGLKKSIRSIEDALTEVDKALQEQQPDLATLVSRLVHVRSMIAKARREAEFPLVPLTFYSKKLVALCDNCMSMESVISQRIKQERKKNLHALITEKLDHTDFVLRKTNVYNEYAVVSKDGLYILALDDASDGLTYHIYSFFKIDATEKEMIEGVIG